MAPGIVATLGQILGFPAEAFDLQAKDFITLATLRSPYLSNLLVRCKTKSSSYRGLRLPLAVGGVNMANAVEPSTADNLGVDRITPNDDRIKHGYTDVNGVKWHYLDAIPVGPQRGTVFLVHGWPDLSLAWRYQIPMLLSLGLRCIAIDCMGYGETGVSDRLSDYTFKAHADGIAGIAKAIGVHEIIVGGHDWGGMASQTQQVVYRAAQWYPDLISHVFSVATPYMEPQKEYLDPAAVIKRLPNFGYQLQLGSEEQIVEKALNGERQLRKFLSSIYGGRIASGKPPMTAEEGISLDVMTDEAETVEPSPLLNQEELEYYLTRYLKTTMHGPCNWYRTRRLNYDEDLQLPEARKSGPNQIPQPTLFIQALGDIVLLPHMSIGMEGKIPNLTRGEVHASHWALWHTPNETNGVIKAWIEGSVFGGGKSKL